MKVIPVQEVNTFQSHKSRLHRQTRLIAAFRGNNSDFGEYLVKEIESLEIKKEH